VKIIDTVVLLDYSISSICEIASSFAKEKRASHRELDK